MQILRGPVVALIILLGATAIPSVADATPLPPQLHTAAGGGGCSTIPISGSSCDNVAAGSVQINGARSVAELPSGGYLFVDHGDDLVREVQPNGKVITVAGTDYVTNPATGATAPSLTDTDNVPATQSGLDDPVAVAALPDGSFLITEAAGRRVRLVTAGLPGAATITTIVGIPPRPPATPGTANPGVPSGVPCDPDTIGACTGAGVELNYPSDAVPTAGGGVLVADTFDHRVLLLSSLTASAGISTIAGGAGTSCSDSTATCNGHAASDVALDQPVSVSELQDGSGGYLIADQGSDTVLQVSQEAAGGAVTTVAGQPGVAGYAGDGGAAPSAQLNQPSMALSTSAGVYLIADTGNNIIRQVSSGTISTIAGDGVAGSLGDGGDATAAELNTPTAIAPATNNGILIADDNNDAIREITQPSVSTVYLNPSTPNGANGWYTVDPVLSVGVTENATIACILDPTSTPSAFAAIPPGCAWSGSGGPLVQNGTHTLWVASENSFADYETPTSTTVKIDTVAPTVKCGKEPSFTRGKKSAKVTAKLTDSIAGPASVTVKAKANTKRAGTFKVTVRGKNLAGVSGSARCPYKVKGAAKKAHSARRPRPS